MVGAMLGRTRKQSSASPGKGGGGQSSGSNLREQLAAPTQQQQQQQQEHDGRLHPSYGAPQDGLRAFKLTPESEFDAFLPSQPNSLIGANSDIALPVVGAGSRSVFNASIEQKNSR